MIQFHLSNRQKHSFFECATELRIAIPIPAGESDPSGWALGSLADVAPACVVAADAAVLSVAYSEARGGLTEILGMIAPPGGLRGAWSWQIPAVILTIRPQGCRAAEERVQWPGRCTNGDRYYPYKGRA